MTARAGLWALPTQGFASLHRGLRSVRRYGVLVMTIGVVTANPGPNAGKNARATSAGSEPVRQPTSGP